MKRIFTVLILCLISSAGYGQLDATTFEEFAGYKTVCKINSYGWNKGEIRYIKNHGYVLFGSTDNQYDRSMASIYLGATKENAIQTINDIESFRRTAVIQQTYVVKGFNNNITELFVRRVLGVRMLMMETENVSGVSNTADHIAYNKEKYIEAIRYFEE